MSLLTLQLDQVKDDALVLRSTLERRTLYRSMRMAEPRFVSPYSTMLLAFTDSIG